MGMYSDKRVDTPAMASGTDIGPARDKQIAAAFKRLTTVIESLESTTADLIARINPILSPVETCKQDGAPCEKASTAPLASEINVASARLMMINDRLCSAERMVEL